jgi:hypothetical protein
MWASKVVVVKDVEKVATVDGDRQPASRFVGWPGEKRDGWGVATSTYVLYGVAAQTRGTSERCPLHPSSLFVHHAPPAT